MGCWNGSRRWAWSSWTFAACKSGRRVPTSSETTHHTPAAIVSWPFVRAACRARKSVWFLSPYVRANSVIASSKRWPASR